MIGLTDELVVKESFEDGGFFHVELPYPIKYVTVKKLNANGASDVEFYNLSEVRLYSMPNLLHLTQASVT